MPSSVWQLRTATKFPRVPSLGRSGKEKRTVQLVLLNRTLMQIWFHRYHFPACSPAMIKDCGVNWVILGHSERRHVFGESDEVIQDGRILLLWFRPVRGQGLIKPPFRDKEFGNMSACTILSFISLTDNVKDWSKVVLAYEPVWAIGTGKTASPQQVNIAHN
ncbi:hypothetical protein XENOCAPTIV_009817 [Xenoophorus captivus]|uniref:Triosephosphate isomerase n=1 Tax=Xenoophorus captivus TaxID=1517983 RepID=A0ABV0RDT2_9TELE